LTEKQKDEFIIKDNINYGDWDYNELTSWNDDKLSEWGNFKKDYKSEEIKNKIITEEEIKFNDKTAEELIETLSIKIRKIINENPDKIKNALAIIIQNGSGNGCLFLCDPSTKDIVTELKRISLSGEKTPLETLVRALYENNT
jgi:hypothetical protein